MAVRISIDVRGLAELQEILRRLRDDFPGSIGAGIYIEAVTVIRRSISIVPVDTSELQHSAWCALPDPSSTNPTSQMGYSATYALPVHERTEVHHDVGEANFLRKPFEAAVAGYAQRLAARALNYVKQGVTAARPDASIPTSPPSVAQIRHKVLRHLERTGRAEQARHHFLSVERQAMRRQKQALAGAAFDYGRGHG